MKQPSRKVKFLALAVAGFISLNGFGAVCLAYCGPEPETRALAAHCGSAELTDAAPSERSGNSIKSATAFDCCPLTLVMVAAPLEPAPRTVIAVQSLPAKAPTIAFIGVAVRPFPASGILYRGPPPADLRYQRIKNSVYLI